MKALEILITIRNSCKVITPIGDFYNYEKSDALIQEAIAELEAPKSCLSCKYFSNVFKECNALDIKWSGVIENFYCSEYEPKDT